MPLDHVAGWIVEGARQYLRGGLGEMPDSIMESVREWSENADPLSAFVAECCELTGGCTAISSLYTAYEKWSEGEGSGRHTVSKRRFVARLVEGFRGLRRETTPTADKGIGGIMLNAEGERLLVL